MIQYIVILLDETSVSFCHYTSNKTEHKLIPLQTLKEGIRFAMKENLNIQFVYPDYELPTEYQEEIDSIDHTDIRPANIAVNRFNDANSYVMVFNSLAETKDYDFKKDVPYLVRTDKNSLFGGEQIVAQILNVATRLNIVITDIETFTEDDFTTYKSFLQNLSGNIKQLYIKGKTPQLNLLTDRMMLDGMNNCNAGNENITLAPDGKFYVCPAFYFSGKCDGNEQSLGEVCQKGYSIGSLKEGLDIKNPQLYKLDHAPICRKCDAYQCRRCVWLNRKTTCEVNTPSHEQCVVAHLERNTSRKLLNNIRKHGSFLSEHEEIKEIDYIDPFEKRNEW